MTRLLLIRHGETAWNSDAVYRGRANVPLSRRGRAQAEALGKRLSPEGVSRILTSPLDRARETAEAIGHACNLAAELCEDLTDIDCGEWQGLSDAELKERYPDLRRVWFHAPHTVTLPDGESLDNVRERACRVLREVETEGGTVALVSHRVVNKVLICLLLGLELARFWDIRIDLAAITVFDCVEGRRVLVAHNDTAHLLRTQSPDRGDF